MKAIKRFFLRLLVFIIIVCMLAAMIIIVINNHVKREVADNIAYVIQDEEVDINAVARKNMQTFQADCALVLGCGIKDEETPSPMLKDRLDAGIALYKEGIVPKILLSGDNGQEYHNELHVMLKYTKEAGVPKEDIFCDHAGFSTFDSVYRADTVFKAKKVLIVTQKYHEYRALYIAEKLDLEAMGVASDQQRYFGETYRNAREALARVKDFFKLIFGGKSIVGGETIPISGSGVLSHGE